MRALPKRKRALVALTAILALSGAAIAQAELSQAGNIRISASGGISPTTLPRTTKAPVGVLMGAKITTTDGSVPPRLERIVLEINSHGSLDTQGLPTCPLGKLNSASAKQALKACGKAQVGHGNVTSRIALPGQGVFATNGPLQAFNGRYKGHPAIFAQVTSTSTLAITYVIIFQIKQAHGTFGTQLDAQLPPIASKLGYISAFDLALKRTYTSHGQSRSYLSANCPVPKGVSQAPFPFARTSYQFADGRDVSVTMTRTCRGRG